MESSITPSPQSPLAQAPPREHCAYCGAPLYSEFYFCLSCATPYKQPESVLPPVRLAPLTEEELIQRKAPHVAPLFWTYMGVVVGSAILGFVAFGQGSEDYTVILGTAAMFVTTCIFGATHWRSLAVQFRHLGFLRWQAWAGIGLLVPLVALNFGYHGLLQYLGGDSVKMRHNLVEGGLSWPAIVVFFCIMPAVLEEIAFRGLVQHWLQVALKPWRAVVIASALFTVLHFSVLSAPYLLLVGMLLGWTKWKTQSLYPSIAIHFLHNYVVLALPQMSW
jgi:membrane protease YdiL (CAAX protease family)